jgi:hypothetical protein
MPNESEHYCSCYIGLSDLPMAGRAAATILEPSIMMSEDTRDVVKRARNVPFVLSREGAGTNSANLSAFCVVPHDLHSTSFMCRPK